MGKNLIQQRRGKANPRYTAKSFHFKGRVRYFSMINMVENAAKEAEIRDIIDCPGHTAPLMQVKINGEECLIIAPEGIKVGDKINV